MPAAVTEHQDIQGLLRTAYGSLPEAVYLLLAIRDRAAAKAWLASARPTVIANHQPRVSRAMQIAFTASGLRALGLSAATLAGFAPEFVAGMADGSRPRRLGDVGPSAPAAWAWGAGATEVHVLVMLFADRGQLASHQGEVQSPAFRAAFATVAERAASDLVGREPFGFVDGASQPVIDWAGERTPGTRDDLDYGNLLAAGELLLGYVNEYGHYTDRPLLPPADDPNNLLAAAGDAPERRDLGRNGSYLVFRQLDQDVRAFWRFLARQGPDPVALAEAMVGRRLSGEPLLPPGARAIRGVGPDPDDLRRNGFTYAGDPGGLVCPRGAHIRRANPRTGDMPGGNQGLVAELLGKLGFGAPSVTNDLVAASRFHRLLRRGRPYGRAIGRDAALAPAGPDQPDPAGSAGSADPADPADSGSGLHFICLNTNIMRQFEFVQSAWIVSSQFDGLMGEQDPLLGTRQPLLAGGDSTAAFTIPGAGGARRCLADLPTFVTTRGGAYFFLPSLRALRYLAS